MSEIDKPMTYEAIMNSETNNQKDIAIDSLKEYLEGLKESNDEEDKKEVEYLENILNNGTEEELRKYIDVVMQMSFLISTCMVEEDDLKCSKLQKRILFDARNDDEHLKKLRYHLIDSVDEDFITTFLTDSEIVKRYESRLDSFMNAYNIAS